MKIKSLLVTCLMMSGLFMACDDNENNSSRFVLKLIDAPGDYEEVNIEVEGVDINVNEEWISLEVEPAVYNLLELTNGAEVVLADEEIPAGSISQIRFILGDDNTLVIEGESQVMELNTPSAQQSGLKLNVQDDIVGGITYSLVMDFDAHKSIVETGSGKYSLKPVIRTFAEAQDGAISGVVTPVESLPLIHAILAGDTITSTYADELTGEFLLRGLEPGTYTVGFDALEGYEDFTEDDVDVTIGEVTDLEEVSIQ